MSEDMSKYKPLHKQLQEASSTDELLEFIYNALEEYDDLAEASEDTLIGRYVSRRSHPLKPHLA